MARRRKRTTDSVKATLDLALSLGELKAGEAYVVDVRHEDRCSLLSRSGPCDCTPEVRAPKRIVSPEEN